MFGQFVAATCNISGMFTAINGPSKAAQIAGFTSENILGKSIWDFGDVGLAESIKGNFAKFLMDGLEIRYRTSSTIAGIPEHWDCRLIPAPSTVVLIVATEVFDDTAELTDEDRQILEYLSNDLTVHQIGLAMQVCDTTVSSKLHRLRLKCQVQTNHGLLAWAIRRGVL